MQQKVPRCPSCKGVVKPDITFFGEKLPASVKRAVEADHNKVREVLWCSVAWCDIVLVGRAVNIVLPFVPQWTGRI